MTSTALIPDSSVAKLFRPASHYQRAQRQKGEVLWVVLHTAECGLVLTAAEALQNFFGLQSTGVSSHYSADPDSVEQSVPEAAIAWAAGHHGNLWGIHIELAGYARETAVDWSAPSETAMLELVARLVADLCARWEIPVQSLEPRDLVGLQRGVTTHAAIARAWPSETNHTDPGAAFPMEAFLDRVRAYLADDQEPPTNPLPDTAPQEG